MSNEPKTKDPQHYVDHEEFTREMDLYSKACAANARAGLEKPRITQSIGIKFMKIAEGMQQESVKESALLMESMTESALAEDQKKKKGRSGLKLIFKKLDELVVKTKVAYIPLSKKIILLCSSFHIRTRAVEDLKSLFSSLHYVSGRSKSRPR